MDVTAADLPSEPRATSLREWFAGARPVVGGAAAAGLMLLACSWFVLDSGALGRSDQVRERAPIELRLPATGAPRDVGARRATPARRSARQAPRLAHHSAATVSPTLAPPQPGLGLPVPTPVPGTKPAIASVAPTPAGAPIPVPPPSTTPAIEVVDQAVPPLTVTVPAVTVPAVAVSTPVLSVSTPELTVTPPAIGIP